MMHVPDLVARRSGRISGERDGQYDEADVCDWSMQSGSGIFIYLGKYKG